MDDFLRFILHCRCFSKPKNAKKIKLSPESDDEILFVDEITNEIESNASEASAKASASESSTVPDQPETSNKSKKNRQSKIEEFGKQFDKITDSEKKKIDLLISKFFFASSLATHQINSKYLKEFCHILRPAYKLPTENQVNNELLSSVYEELLTSSRPIAEEEATLILILNDSKFEAYGQLPYKKKVFFGDYLSWNVLEHENKTSKLFDLIKLDAKAMLNIDLTMMLHNIPQLLDSPLIKKKFKFSALCHYKIAEKLASEISNPGLKEKLIQIISMFQNLDS